MPTTRPQLAVPSPAADRGSPWRLPAPPQRSKGTDQRWMAGLAGLLVLGLLLAFCKVVSNGVRRGELLRSQFVSSALACDDMTPDDRALACSDKAPYEATRRTRAAVDATAFPTLMLASRQ